MILVNLTHVEQLENLFKSTPKEAHIVLGRALNRAATAAKTRASVEIRKNYVIKAADVKSKIKIRKATQNRLEAQIRASGPVTPLSDFDITPTMPDIMVVRARVKKGGRKPIQNGFVARMGNGHINVFTRANSNRLPIQGRYGPSIAQMMGSDAVIRSVESRAEEVLNERLQHELDRLLRGAM